MALLRLSKPVEELEARELVYLDAGYVSTELDPASLRTLASARRQALFNVTLALGSRATATPGWVAELVGEAEASPDLSLLLMEEPPRGAWHVDEYSDVLPLNVTMYLDPGVPSELGPKAVRLRELVSSARRLKALGAEVPSGMALEMRSLDRELWAAATRSRRFISAPGFLQVDFLTYSGARSLRLRATPGASLSPLIRALHRRLSGELGAPGDPATGRGLTRAFISARSTGYGEARIPATIVVRRAGGTLELGGAERARQRAASRVRGWVEPSPAVSAQILALTGGLFEAREVGLTNSPVWLPLRGEAVVRVKWVEGRGQEAARLAATMEGGAA